MLSGRSDGAAGVAVVQAQPEEALPAAAEPARAAPADPVTRQGELPMGDLPGASATNGATKAPTVTSADLALLIARLTVIRQNLVEALEPTG